MAPFRLLIWLAPLLLLACVSAESWEAVRVLKDIEAGGRPSELKAATPAPSRMTLWYQVADRPSVADLYQPNQPVGAALVLVPGFTPHGKDDRRLVELATSLARARFLVLVPDLQGSRDIRVRLSDARTIADAVVHLAELTPPGERVGLVAISYAVGLAVLASSEPEVRDKVDFLVGLGGYYDTTDLVTFMTTGSFTDQASGQRRRLTPDPAAKWIFLASNLDLVADPEDRQILLEIAERRLASADAPIAAWAERLGSEGQSLYGLITNQDPAQVAALLAALPAPVRAQLGRLSLSNRDLAHLSDRLILIHGREDTLVSYSESQALAAAVPGTELFLIDGFSHIDPTSVPLAGRLQLIDAVIALLQRRHGP